jgi:ribA/ribD-fused uncharacterized protein
MSTRRRFDAVVGQPISGFHTEHRWLSNFWPTTVLFEGLAFPSSEHAYVAAKTEDLATRKLIAESKKGPGAAKRLGKSLEQPGWSLKKVAVMTQIVREKFRDPELRSRLVATGSRPLIEANTWGDTFWGVCNGRGENMLGRILMATRAEILKGSDSTQPLPTPAPAPQKSTRGGTPYGWSFYSNWLDCRFRFFLRSVLGLTENRPATYFTLGSSYHALHEGLSPSEILDLGPEFRGLMEKTDKSDDQPPAIIEEAIRLYQARLDGPPLPPATAVEQTLTVNVGPLKGLFTSRPDRIEDDGFGLVARDFKTALMEKQTAADAWDIHGGMLGELLATGASRAIVDVIVKTKVPKIRLYELRMTEAKRHAFETLILGALLEIRAAMEKWSKRGWANAGTAVYHLDPDSSPATTIFPKNLNACVGQYGRCPYYELCWGSGMVNVNLQRHKEQTQWQKHLL